MGCYICYVVIFVAKDEMRKVAWICWFNVLEIDLGVKEESGVNHLLIMQGGRTFPVMVLKASVGDLNLMWEIELDWGKSDENQTCCFILDQLERLGCTGQPTSNCSSQVLTAWSIKYIFVKAFANSKITRAVIKWCMNLTHYITNCCSVKFTA